MNVFEFLLIDLFAYKYIIMYRILNNEN